MPSDLIRLQSWPLGSKKVMPITAFPQQSEELRFYTALQRLAMPSLANHKRRVLNYILASKYKNKWVSNI